MKDENVKKEVSKDSGFKWDEKTKEAAAVIRESVTRYDAIRRSNTVGE